MNLFAPFNSDGYKISHAAMYADGTTMVYSNLTPRSDRIHRRNTTRYYDGKLVLVGCQGAFIEIVENWQKFFAMDKGIAIARFKLLCDNYLGRDVVSVEHLSKLHDLGYLPLEIKTLDEGSKVPMGIPVLTIRNTVDHAYWLVNFLETTISNLIWKSSTTATIAAEYKAMLTDFAIKTGSPLEAVAFQAHDFSARGMSGPEDAARSGFGHICNFLGTDSLGSVLYAQEYYGAGDFVAASVPATEHAVATSNILKIERELEEQGYPFPGMMQAAPIRLYAEQVFMEDLITRKFPTGIVSVVSDSFDFWSVLTQILPSLKDVILARQSNGITPGKLVIRPDSGDPVDVVCGTVQYLDVSEAKNFESAKDWAEDILREQVSEETKHGERGEDEPFGYFQWEGKTYKMVLDIFWNRHDKQYYYIDEVSVKSCEQVELTPEQKGAIQVLWETFGGTTTDKGYKLLDEHIGLIYGDSITTQRCLQILERLEAKGFASVNCVFGVGSFTYQCITRDTFGEAVKATYTEVNGEGIAIFKDPKTDSKKKSAKGLLCVVPSDAHGMTLVDEVSKEVEQSDYNLLKTRYKDGQFLNQTTLGTIRAKL